MNAAMILSWLKVFLSAMLTAVLADLVDGGFQGLNWEVALIAGLVAVLPAVINWLDPNDPRYGRGYVEPPVVSADRGRGGYVADPDDSDGMGH